MKTYSKCIRYLLGLGLLVAGSANAQVTISGAARNVTGNPAMQLDPSIDGDRVVYTDYRAGNADIYFTDLVTGAETLVTNAPGGQVLQDISGDNVVFNDSSPASGKNTIIIYSITSGNSMTVNTSHVADSYPTIAGNYVVFEGQSASNIGIYAYDLAAGSTMVVADGPAYEQRPRINAGEVIFERQELDASYSVIVHGIVSGTDTVLASGLQGEPRPDIAGPWAVWVEGIPGGTQDIKVLNRGTGVVSTFGGPGDQNWPRVDGDVLAYNDNGGTDQDVVLVYLPSGTVHRIAGVGSYEYLDDVSGNRVAYTGTASGNDDIWVYEFTVTIPSTLPVDACVDPQGQTPAGSYTLTGPGAVFITGSGSAQVAVTASGCAGASLSLDGQPLLGPADFAAAGACWSFDVSLSGAASAELSLPAPTCTDDDEGESGDDDGEDGNAGDHGEASEHHGDHHHHGGAGSEDAHSGDDHASESEGQDEDDGDDDGSEASDCDDVPQAAMQCSLSLDVYLPPAAAGAASQNFVLGTRTATLGGPTPPASCDSGPGAATWWVLLLTLAGLGLGTRRRPAARIQER